MNTRTVHAKTSEANSFIDLIRELQRLPLLTNPLDGNSAPRVRVPFAVASKALMENTSIIKLGNVHSLGIVDLGLGVYSVAVRPLDLSIGTFMLPTHEEHVVAGGPCLVRGYRVGTKM